MQLISTTRAVLKYSATILAAASLMHYADSAHAVNLQVTIENIGPSNGVAITPVWVGLHDGSFDSYDGGTPAAGFIEALAEDGNNQPISDEFNLVAGRRDVLGIGSSSGPPPISAGESASFTFNNVATDGSNEYFSYASMVLPSNDFFLANGNPTAHNLSSLYGGSGSISFLIGTTAGGSSPVNDAGTEEEDFDTVAPGTGPLQNVLFPGRNFAADAGQTAANQGAADATTTIQNVTGADPFGSFANINGADLSGFDFNNAALYTGGAIARVTIRAIPEPSSLALLSMGALAFSRYRRRR